jgi:hypothetical protein
MLGTSDYICNTFNYHTKGKLRKYYVNDIDTVVCTTYMYMYMKQDLL